MYVCVDEGLDLLPELGQVLETTGDEEVQSAV